MISWEDIRYLNLVGEGGSFSSAARALKMNHSSVARRMRAMEEATGLQLFERNAQHVRLTETGRALVDASRHMASGFQNIERLIEAERQGAYGRIRFATVDMTARLLMPLLADFSKAWPDIEVELMVGQNLANLSQNEVDVVLRATNNPPETLIGRKIFDHRFRVYGAPSLMARFPQNADLSELPWVRWQDGFSGQWVAEHYPDVRTTFTANTAFGVTEAVRAGLGVGVLSFYHTPADDDVIALSDVIDALALDVWLLYHPDLKRSARIKVFCDFLADEFKRKARTRG